jgi:hypothetical protein
MLLNEHSETRADSTTMLEVTTDQGNYSCSTVTCYDTTIVLLYFTVIYMRISTIIASP